MTGDVIRDLIGRILEAAHREGSFTESMALEIERQWRHDNRGEKITISGRMRPDEAAKEAMVAAYLANEPIDEIASRHNISRRTMYRYLKK